MQQHRYAFPTLTVLLVTVIMVVAVTPPVVTRLLAQTGSREAPTRIGSEPVDANGRSTTAAPGSPNTGPDGIPSRTGSPAQELGPIDLHMLTGPSGSSLAANGDYVFVLRGDTLYQFSIRNLQLVGKVSLEEAERSKRR
jgi:hypothetical protein